MTPKIPMQDDEIKMHKPVCAEFVDFRAGIRCAERVYDVAKLLQELEAAKAMLAAQPVAQQPYCWLYKDDIGECQIFFVDPPEYSLALYRGVKPCS